MSHCARAAGSGIARILLRLLVVFNVLSSVMGLIGFLVIGEWVVVGFGLLMMYFMPKIYGFVAGPHIGLGMLSFLAFRKGRHIIGFILALASSLYNNLVIAAWIYIAFRVFLELQVAIVPFLWAYAVATVPFGTMAMQEQEDNSSTNLFLFMIQITSIAFGVARYAGAGPSDLLIIAATFVGVATAVNALLMFMGRAALRDKSVEV